MTIGGAVSGLAYRRPSVVGDNGWPVDNLTYQVIPCLYFSRHIGCFRRLEGNYFRLYGDVDSIRSECGCLCLPVYDSWNNSSDLHPTLSCCFFLLASINSLSPNMLRHSLDLGQIEIRWLRQTGPLAFCYGSCCQSSWLRLANSHF
jgi:hypothetical protein